MQNHSLPLLLTTRENYIVPKGEEHSVHYKAERIAFNSKDGRTRISHPELIKTEPKLFDIIKRDLEMQGYVIEILFHPEGKYTNTRIPVDADTELKVKDEKIAALEAEIAALKMGVSVEKCEGEKEITPENEVAKKVGRPSKK